MMLEGGCACGRTRYRLASPPMFVNCCHCRRCQHETGSAFAVNALIETERLEMLGEAPSSVAVPTDSQRAHRIFRCETCKTAIASEYGGVAKLRFVRVGTLDDPSAAPPDAHVFTRSKAAWLTLPEGAPAFDVFYDSKKLWPAESLLRRAAVFT